PTLALVRINLFCHSRFEQLALAQVNPARARHTRGHLHPIQAKPGLMGAPGLCHTELERREQSGTSQNFIAPSYRPTILPATAGFSFAIHRRGEMPELAQEQTIEGGGAGAEALRRDTEAAQGTKTDEELVGLEPEPYRAEYRDPTEANAEAADS